MKVAIVGPEHLGSAWPHVEHLLKPAIDLSGGRYTVDTTRAAISRGQMQLWIAFEGTKIFAAMTSTVSVYPAKTMLAVVHCGGRMMGLWLQTMSEIEEWAKAQGCAGVEITGRAGWAKALPDYRRVGVLIERYF